MGSTGSMDGAVFFLALGKISLCKRLMNAAAMGASVLGELTNQKVQHVRFMINVLQ